MNLDKKDEKQLFNLLSDSTLSNTYELEALFKKSGKKDIDRETWERIFRTLKKTNNLKRIEVNPTLEVYLENNNVRVSIIGNNNINKYKKTNDLNVIESDCLQIMKKKIAFDKSGKKIPTLMLSDYDVKIKLRSEIIIESDNTFFQKLKDEWKSFKKFFRFKTRYTFVDKDNLFSFDLSIIKNSSKENNQFIYYKKVSESAVFSNPQEYEVEIEFIGNNENKYSKVDLQSVYKQLIANIELIIKIIQRNKYILSNSQRESLLENYCQVICQKSLDPLIRSKLEHKGHGGIGPKVVSLEMKNIFIHEKEILNKYFKTTQVPSIRVDYCVTEKTDGDRQFLFISNNGQAFLLDHLMNFKDTDIHFQNFKNCIFDGEYVTQSKQKENINHFLIFDCYFFNNTDVRNLPLYTPDKEIKLESRLDKVKQISKEFKKMEKNVTSKFKIFSKDHKKGNINTPGTDIFKRCAKIWTDIQQDRYEYDVDGLIFTPIKSPVGGKYDKTDKFYSGRTWYELLKWKPSQDNTIDFLVRIQQENGKDKIGYKNVDGEIRKYKTLLLYVGNNISNKNIDPYELISEVTKPLESKDIYAAQEFIPSDPMDPEAYIAHIYLVSKNNREEMYTLRGEVIKNEMIVEMSYNKDLEKNWRWIPRNIRYDKTALRERGDSQFGNNFKTAESIWSSYYNPITEDMILKGRNIPLNPLDDKIYYHIERNKRTESPLRSLRDFHNLYVKDKLYSCTSNMFNKPSLLELACGKAGDLPRWIKYDFSLIVGIDVTQDNIENKINGAIKRYSDHKERYSTDTKMYFLTGDCGQNIKNGSFATNFYHNIYKILWNSDKGVDINRKIDTSCFGVCQQGFDIISCQFAIHYFFKNLQSLEGFIQNLVENIKENGFFIGTCFDGKTIFENLQHLDQDSKIGYQTNDNQIWNIKKLYQHNKMKDDESSLGMEIDVYVSSIGEYQKEYLVNFNYFVSLMAKNGFELLEPEDCSTFNIPCGTNNKSSGLFDKMYKNMHLESNTHNMNSSKYGSALSLELQFEIQKYSFFNRWFIFRKTGSGTKVKKIKVKK